MSERLTAAQADTLLALQLSVAWAGESAGDPPRLAWWRSDLVDAEGGGDLFRRLVPRTAAWASLCLVREAARRTDLGLREALAGGDTVWTLFHLGFTIDEQLGERLTYHRAHRHVPSEVFGQALLTNAPWSRSGFETWLGRLGKPKAEVTSVGRKLHVASSAWPETATLRALHLAPLLTAALLPLSASYPLPFIEVPA